MTSWVSRYADDQRGKWLGGGSALVNSNTKHNSWVKHARHRKIVQIVHWALPTPQFLFKRGNDWLYERSQNPLVERIRRDDFGFDEISKSFLFTRKNTRYKYLMKETRTLKTETSVVHHSWKRQNAKWFQREHVLFHSNTLHESSRGDIDVLRLIEKNMKTLGKIANGC